MAKDPEMVKSHGILKAFSVLQVQWTDPSSLQWQYKNRADGTIIQSNGKKINPFPLTNLS